MLASRLGIWHPRGADHSSSAWLHNGESTDNSLFSLNSFRNVNRFIWPAALFGT
jgi:hypothetical protein